MLSIYLSIYIVGEVRYEVHDDGNGTVLDYVNSVVSQEVGVAFEGVWLLLVHWDHVPSTADPTQVEVNDIHGLQGAPEEV